MRQALDHKRRDRQQDVPNIGTSRTASKRKSSGNPIPVPTNSISLPLSHAKFSGRMKTSVESRTRIETPSEPRVTPKSRLNTANFQTNTRRSSRLSKKQPLKTKKSEVIEIDSEDEKAKADHFFDAELDMPSSSSSSLPLPPPPPPSSSPPLKKRRRLIRHDTEEEEEESVPLVRRKTASSPINPYQFNPTRNVKTHEEKEPSLLKKTIACASELMKQIIPSLEDSNEEEIEDIQAAYDIPSVATVVQLPHDPIDDYQVVVTGADQHLLTYPFKGKKSVTVYERDLDRLNDETYLNDTLIDVFPKIWSDEFSRASIYTFSSFFYTKLAGPNHSIHYDTVKRWTLHVDIFEKKFLIIPIAQHNHWFVIVVANPGYCIQKDGQGIYSEEETVEKDEDPVKRYVRLARLKKKIITAGTPLDSKKPYIFTLDPLNLSKGSVARVISNYLKNEALTRLGIEPDEFTSPEIVMAPCPGQKNFTDCGVFCLHYMKSLYQFPDAMMKTLYNNIEDEAAWDKDHSLPGFRTHLKRILKRTIRDYREYLLSHLESQ